MGSALLFSEPRTWRGTWWIPGFEERRDGVLTYNPAEGLHLDLVGGLSSRRPRSGAGGVSTVASDDGVFDIVIGTVGRQAITLLDCFPRPPRGHADLSVSDALFGIHLTSADDVTFDRVETSFEGLTAWSDRSALSIARKESRHESIGIQLPDDQVAKIGQDEYRIVHWSNQKWEHRGDGTSVSVRQEAHLNVEPQAPMTWQALLDRAGRVTELVSLARRSRPAFLWFRVRPAGLKTSSRDPYAGWANVLWQQPATAARDERVAFTAEDRGFEATLRDWLARRNDLINAANLVQAVWDEGWYLESAVLALATATESLGSAMGLPKKMPKADYNRMITAMLEVVPPNERDWLSNALGPLNGPSFHQKAMAIANQLPVEVQSELLPSASRWATVLREARNDLSHSGHSNRHTSAVLASLLQVTSTVLYLVLLLKIGVPSDRLKEIMYSDPYLRYAAERSARHLSDASD